MCIANVAIDGALLDDALRIGGKTTKQDTVTEALQEYVARRQQARLADFSGTIDYDPKYDSKKQRRKR
ncbi:MAG: type II toxin-antitoxin system VapB family antitoxin [Vicinamibacterales bacterium]